eukprot:CAMPEP_0114691096 /NCGR_PEP_ID=MMETSP0191-20121206/66433_1 /TAXON_ID=126664 /ORGANISM="Sorites sp." /LENGTH=452 /DNA_ID=CAMNT_0001981831 /DNA_START=373 /DNA_END=1731 /DNA_ORIENTATION=+
MALCPVLPSTDGSKVLSDYTWGNRGWCRIEQVVRELTVEGRGAWIVVKSAMHQELKLSPLTNSSPGEGHFTVESDRGRVAGLLQRFLEKKLLACLKIGDIPHYRLLLNKQKAFLRNLPADAIEDLVPGFEPESQGSLALSYFLHQNGFRTPLEYDSAGWSPLCYACVKGDAVVIKSLLEQQADPNTKTKKARGEVNIDKHSPVLSICARFKNHEAMNLLIQAKASVNSQAVHSPLGVACLANDAEGIQLLCEAKADPYAQNPFGDHSLNMAAAAGSLDAINTLLKAFPNLDVSGALHCAVMLQGGSSAVVMRLVEAMADVDAPYTHSSTVVAMVHRAKGLQYRYGRRTMMRRMAYHSRGATPLMLAIICGNYEAAARLLFEGASPHKQNAKGVSPAALAEELGGMPDYLLAALGGQIQECSFLVTSGSWTSSVPSVVSIPIELGIDITHASR